MKTLNTLILVLIAIIAMASDVEIRFANQDFSMERMYVDVEVRAKSGSFILGSQNLRAYYNTSAVTLNEELTKSSLSTELYNELKVVSKFEKVNADEVNQLSFDNDLGFINITIELADMVNGGVQIDGEWLKVAVLAFDVKDSKSQVELIWARQGKSDQYATAFVEMAEWVSPNVIISKNVEEFNDLITDVAYNTYAQELSLEIGPNPTADYVVITQNKNNTSLMIVDFSGKIVRESNLATRSERVDIKSLSSGSYIFYINDGINTIAEKILKVK